MTSYGSRQGGQVLPPYRNARVTLLALTWALGVIGGAFGLNALIQGNRSKSEVKKSVQAGITLTIDSNDIDTAGIFLAVFCTLLSVISSLFLPSHLPSSFPLSFPLPSILSITGPRSSNPTRAIRVQAFTLLALSLLILSALVPYDLFAIERSAKISAMIGKLSVPDSELQEQEKGLGISAKYWDSNFIRWQALSSIPAFLLSLLASLLHLHTANVLSKSISTNVLTRPTNGNAPTYTYTTRMRTRTMTVATDSGSLKDTEVGSVEEIEKV
ncbi:hypothetical protein BD410DRAFT_649820 [Rickenella mellea]|uniref:Uncharacterized protein n=1 Tax=Rickenella mellea TaxID=50990 RepID=A0A4Y7PL29_9AGAM|nr:hypothetical protein BD410DRAFT_649820 [Rickenella mellea]